MEMDLMFLRNVLMNGRSRIQIQTQNGVNMKHWDTAHNAIGHHLQVGTISYAELTMTKLRTQSRCILYHFYSLSFYFMTYDRIIYTTGYRVSSLSQHKAGGYKSAILRGYPDVLACFQSGQIQFKKYIFKNQEICSKIGTRNIKIEEDMPMSQILKHKVGNPQNT